VERHAGERTGNSREWLNVKTFRDSAGSTFVTTNRCVELATGMSFWDGQEWVLSDPRFDATTNGFAATRTQHKVRLSGNINQEVAVVLTTPDGKVLRSTPIGIGLYDTASGRSLIIGEITDSEGVLVGSNRVVYADAFKGVCADVVYTINRHSFEQDVIFTGRINPADYNFPTNTTLIEIFTEFHGDSPEPEITRRPLRVEKDKAVRDRMVSPDLVDETLVFGEMVFPTGRAASYATLVSDLTAPAAPVAKMYLRTPDRRKVLVESVQYSWIANDLLALPECQAGALTAQEASVKGARKDGFALLPSPVRPTTATAGVRKRTAVMTAAMLDKRPGVAIDYIVTLGSGWSVFQGDTTYLVTGPVPCYNPVTIEGGAVVKFKVGAGPITFDSTVTCKTSRYRPAIFTGIDDNSVGESMAGYVGYTGNILDTGYAYVAVVLNWPQNQPLSNLRFAYCQRAVMAQGYDGVQATISHSQFVDCIQGILTTGGGCGSFNGCTAVNLTADNVLFSRVDYPFEAYITSSGTFRQCTVDQAVRLITCPPVDQWYNFYNCIIANSTTRVSSGGCIFFSGNKNGFYNNGVGFGTIGTAAITTSSNPFQGFGASAAYYLSSGHPFKNAGTTSGFAAGLLNELKLRTTDSPAILSGSVSSDTTLSPIVLGDWDIPDLGYHYARLDYVLNNVTLSARLKLENGVAIGLLGSSALNLQSGASVNSVGTPIVLNQFVSLANVHEQVVDSASSTLMTLGSAMDDFTADFQFTDFSVGQGRLGRIIDPGSGNPFNRLSFRDCWLRNASFALAPVTVSPVTVGLTNNILQRCYLALNHSGGAVNTPLSVYFYNNLVLGNPTPATLRALSVTYDSGTSNPDWEIRDNLFDGCLQLLTGTGTAYVKRSYNGFTTGTGVYLGGTDNVIGLSPNYVSGPLGTYYYPAVGGLAALRDRDVSTADTAGLYHYTTQTNANSKEAASRLDIGFHYVALNASGKPIDTDTDELSDYLEDSNGNGVYNSGDFSDWLDALADADADGLPDAWEVRHFGDMDESGYDFDQDGRSNLAEYEAGTEPNTIAYWLNIENEYVKVSTVPVEVEIRSGEPARKAVLIDSEDFASATWTSYSSPSMAVNLGANEGWHNVWIGLKGRADNSKPTWQRLRIKLDTTPPVIAITQPAGSTVVRPIIQVEGTANEPLGTLSYDIQNSTGSINDQAGFVTGKDMDQATFEFTTCRFQLYDVELASGQNNLTLHAVDLAGNTATLQTAVTLDMSTVSAGPVISLIWPQDGAEISGNKFTLRGKLDDETATAEVSITDAQNQTTTVTAIVERNGILWGENLPLAAGNNTVTVRARNAAGFETIRTLTVVKSAVQLTFDYSPSCSLLSGVVPMSGVINATGYEVVVNGVPATLTDLGDGTWRWDASNVPVIGIGTAVFEAVATPIPPENVGGGGTAGEPMASGAAGGGSSVYASIESEMPPEIVPVGYRMSMTFTRNGIVQYTRTKGYSATIQTAANGMPQFTFSGTGTHSYRSEVGAPLTTVDYAWSNNDPKGMAHTVINGEDVYYPIEWSYYEDLETSVPHASFDHMTGLNSGFVSHYKANPGEYTWDEGTDATVTVTANTEEKLFTGKAIGRKKNLYCLYTDAGEFARAWGIGYGPWHYTDGRKVPSESIKIGGIAVDVNGIAFLSVPEGATPDVTISAPARHHNGSASVTKHTLVNRCHAAIPADRTRSKLGVGEEVSLDISPGLPPGYVATWVATSGTVEPPTGDSVTFTAPERKNSANVKVVIGRESMEKDFEVVEPSGDYTPEIVEPFLRVDPVGAGMNLRVYFHPRDVSFYNVWIYEVPGPASNPKGYFVNVEPPPHDELHGAGVWWKLGEDNSWGDEASFFGWPPNVNGSYDWVIPAQWRVGNNGTIKSPWTTWVQSHTITEGRRGTVEKLGLCVDQTPLTFSEPCQ